MNSEWKTFLTEQNAVFEDNGEVSFPASGDSECSKMDLSYFGVIRISGEDKQTFLQGQLTNDTRNISDDKSQLSSYCTPKGRMLASFRLFQHGDNWYLVLPRERLDAILKRLRMFVLMSKVELEDVSDSMICIGLSGDCINEQLPHSLPAQQDDVTHAEGISYIRVEDKLSRYMAFGDVAGIKALWQSLADAMPVSSSDWRLLDIRAGIPMVYEETVEAFIPQMINLQLINGVSFTKGCYTGQEVVARMQYLGKLKRRMYPVSFESDVAPKPGDEIFSDASQSGQGAGRLVDVVKVGDNRYEGLSVIEISNVGQAKLQLLNSNGPVLEVSQPPYEFEQDEA
ncbi:MAG: folate-binding protein YgfZ [Chromatiales bacterium]|jgi:folate-binding protein YgfZ